LKGGRAEVFRVKERGELRHPKAAEPSIDHLRNVAGRELRGPAGPGRRRALVCAGPCQREHAVQRVHAFVPSVRAGTPDGTEVEQREALEQPDDAGGV
jgi:hypothetical protein